MNVETRTGQRITDGSSPKWSPDGETVAYLQDNGVWLYDVRRGNTRQILHREDHRYQDLGDSIAWSPDSKRVVLVANIGESSELVILPISGEEKPQVRCSLNSSCEGNLAWNTDQEIVFCLRETNRDQGRMVAVSPDDDSPPKQMSQFDDQHAWKSACLTPDRKWYIAVSRN